MAMIDKLLGKIGLVRIGPMASIYAESRDECQRLKAVIGQQQEGHKYYLGNAHDLIAKHRAKLQEIADLPSAKRGMAKRIATEYLDTLYGARYHTGKK